MSVPKATRSRYRIDSSLWLEKRRPGEPLPLLERLPSRASNSPSQTNPAPRTDFSTQSVKSRRQPMTALSHKPLAKHDRAQPVITSNCQNLSPAWDVLLAQIAGATLLGTVNSPSAYASGRAGYKPCSIRQHVSIAVGFAGKTFRKLLQMATHAMQLTSNPSGMIDFAKTAIVCRAVTNPKQPEWLTITKDICSKFNRATLRIAS